MRKLLALLAALAFATPIAAQTIGPPPGGGASCANPTATVGTTATNGSASTCIRSDGAPAIDQTMAPTWTGAHTWTPAANTTPQTISSYSLTGTDTHAMVSWAGTLNTSGTPTDVVKVAVTDTAHGTVTRLLNLYGGASGTTTEFNVDLFGNVRVASGILSGCTTTCGAPLVDINSSFTGVVAVPISGGFSWSSTSAANGTRDTAVCRAAPGVVEISNSTTCNTGGGLTAGGVITFAGVTTGTNADFACFAAGGVMTLQNSACTISSRRFKTAIIDEPAFAALDTVMKLVPVAFNMKPAPNPDPNYAKRQVGLTAENVAAVDPRLAIYEDDGKTPKSYRQEAVIAELVGAVKAQQQEIEALRAELHRHRR